MSDFSRATKHLEINDYVEIDYERNANGDRDKARGVVDEIEDGEYPYIEVLRGGSAALRLTWGIEGAGPPSVTVMRFKEQIIGNDAQFKVLTGSL